MKKFYVWGLLLSQESNASTVSITDCNESTPLIRGGKLQKIKNRYKIIFLSMSFKGNVTKTGKDAY